jgi:uncharacterized protein YcfJ
MSSFNERTNLRSPEDIAASVLLATVSGFIARQSGGGEGFRCAEGAGDFGRGGACGLGAGGAVELPLSINIRVS